MAYQICVDGEVRETSADEAANIEKGIALLAAYEAQRIRDERNRLLAACDWTQGSDVPASINKIAWANYRTALRNVPQQSGFPNDVVWPTPPSQ